MSIAKLFFAATLILAVLALMGSMGLESRFNGTDVAIGASLMLAAGATDNLFKVVREKEGGYISAFFLWALATFILITLVASRFQVAAPPEPPHPLIPV